MIKNKIKRSQELCKEFNDKINENKIQLNTIASRENSNIMGISNNSYLEITVNEFRANQKWPSVNNLQLYFICGKKEILTSSIDFNGLSVNFNEQHSM